MSTDSGDSARREANRRETGRPRVAAGGHVDVIDELDSLGGGSEYNSTLSHNDVFAPLRVSVKKDLF